jgi:VCBS repeat-containing protein
MGRRALVIAMAAFLVVVIGAVLTWVIISSGTPQAAPTPDPTTPVVTPSATPSATPTPTSQPSDPAAPAPASVAPVTAKPAPRSVSLAWTAPVEPEVIQVLVVVAAGATAPVTPSAGTVLADLPPQQSTFTDARGVLAPGQQYSYSVFARTIEGSTSEPTGVTVTLPAALTVTPVKVAGTVTQVVPDATLTDEGSLAFTAFDPSGPRTVVVTPRAGALGAISATVTEPVGTAPGTVAWSYAIANADARSLAEGAKRVETFVVELRGGADRVATTVTIDVLGINDAPTASGIASQTAFVGDAFAFPVPAGAFSDVDATDTLTLSAGTLPAWLAFDSVAGFSGTPSAADGGTVTVTVTATDPHGATASADVAIDVVTPLPAPNTPPVPVDDEVIFDLGVDPLQATGQLLTNDADPDGAPNPLAVLPDAGPWLIDGEVAGAYTIDADGILHLDSGVDAAGPLQRLGPDEHAVAVIVYSVTDGVDTVAAEVTVTAIGAPLDDKDYDVSKAFVPVAAEPGKAFGRAIG